MVRCSGSDVQEIENIYTWARWLIFNHLLISCIRLCPLITWAIVTACFHNTLNYGSLRPSRWSMGSHPALITCWTSNTTGGSVALAVAGVRLEFGNYPTLSFSSLTGDFVPLSGNPWPQGMYGTGSLSVSGFAYFRTDQRHGVRNRSISDTETLLPRNPRGSQ